MINLMVNVVCDDKCLNDVGAGVEDDGEGPMGAIRGVVASANIEFYLV